MQHGTLVVDDGAYRALLVGKKSLLPGGIVTIKGIFEEGQVVELETAKGRVFGRGVVHYNNAELERIIGKRTDQIEAILGRKSRDEVIHRNDLVIWEE